jgi:PiT family inorganic phosphate transporter
VELLTVLAFVLTVGLAAANGSNDVSKGVATLAGAGVTKHRNAVVWGALTTLIGALFSVGLASAMTKLFTDGIVSTKPTPVFAIAVLCGTTAWVALATATRLPVSTTQALVGSMIGAGLLFAPASVNWSVLLTKVAQPMVLSVVVAFAVSYVLARLPGRVPECICAEPSRIPALAGAPAGPGDPGALAFTATGDQPGGLHLTAGTATDCRAHAPTARRLSISLNGLHWLSSGATSFARGLNDTPKLVAVGAFALVPAGLSTTALLWVVALAMLAGALGGGVRLTRRLSGDVVRMSDLEGFKANATTAVLVGLGAWQGLPMSTTQVSTGAIAGSAGDVSRVNHRTLRDFAVGWTVTPVVAGLVAAAVFAVANR